MTLGPVFRLIASKVSGQVRSLRRGPCTFKACDDHWLWAAYTLGAHARDGPATRGVRLLRCGAVRKPLSRAVAGLVLVTAPLLTASTCDSQGVTKACDVRYQDLVVRDGLVVGTVHPVCDPPPRSHLLRAVLEVSVGETWIDFGRAAVVDGIPDATGFDVEVRAECREAVYRMRVHVEGAGPTGSPFVFDDTSPETAFSLTQCAT